MTAIVEIERWSPNHSARPIGTVVDCIVIHDTGSHTAASTLNWFSRPESGVSAHVVIDRDGTVYRCVPDTRKAWHAGKSVLHGRENVNNFSLGVELVDVDPGPAYTALQLDAAVRWCADKVARFNIPLNRIVGHDAVSPGRKVDPGPDFGWRSFLLRVASAVTVT
jgi:N-acetylmuramoyl-L-alanine amidase